MGNYVAMGHNTGDTSREFTGDMQPSAQDEFD